MPTIGERMDRPTHYVLDGHLAVPVDDILEWGRKFQGQDRVVARTEVGNGLEVSTVFLGLDYAVQDPPRLFESMIFSDGEPRYDRQWRYATWDEAVAGHERLVAWYRGEGRENDG